MSLDSKRAFLDFLGDLEIISDIWLSYSQVFHWDTKLSKMQGAENCYQPTTSVEVTI